MGAVFEDGHTHASLRGVTGLCSRAPSAEEECADQNLLWHRECLLRAPGVSLFAPRSWDGPAGLQAPRRHCPRAAACPLVC